MAWASHINLPYSFTSQVQDFLGTHREREGKLEENSETSKQTDFV